VATELRVTLRGDQEVIRALNALPREAQDEVRDGSTRLAESLMRKMRGRASSNRQARAAARTLHVIRDRFPTVEAGPEKRLAGSEFGATAHFGWYRRARYWESAGDQYRKHLGGKAGYWFYATLERERDTINRAHREMVDNIVRRWSA
jgi:hypothetical protein